MPLEQRTFAVVPPPGMPSKGPRPPMTSKQAKKLYKQATPKVTRAEQRRIEAEELERIKWGHEKERAAERSKAAREKKQKKANEAREMRRKMRLPEPSRWVRASQPTIMRFVNVEAGAKRTRDDINDETEGDIEGGIKDADDERLADHGHSPEGESIAKRVALAQPETDEEFGPFPLSSQSDFPKLLDTEDRVEEHKHDDSNNGKATESFQSSRTVQAASQKSTNNASPRYGQYAPSSAESLEALSNAELDTTIVENQFLAAPSKVCSTSQRAIYPELATETSPRPAESGKILKGRKYSVTIAHNTDWRCQKVDMGFRVPLGEVKNMPPPSVPAKSKPVASPSKNGIQPDMGLYQSSAAPPSTALAFLEANLDMFLPSPSQQVRELLEDIDDIPSNSQVAREIGAENGRGTATLGNLPSQSSISLPPAKSLQSARTLRSATARQSATSTRPTKPFRPAMSKIQLENDDLGLEFLSSQDLEISSEDLRDINTPSGAATPQLTQNGSQGGSSFKVATCTLPRKTKPRFFEEKEEDLLHAAIHESLRAAEQKHPKPSQRRSQRSQRRVSPTKSEFGDEDFEEGMEPELLAVLEKAEELAR
jgi:hypothetical protein